MAYPASVIADVFVQKGINEGRFLTQMKLQKVVFFAHGYHLARYGEPLIQEKFQAWKFGPVVPSIYQDYKLYGSRPIIDTRLLTHTPDFVTLDEMAQEAINYTWKVTKGLSAETLSNWTHQPNSPWSEVYNPNDWAIPIRDERIRHYFEGLVTTND